MARLYEVEVWSNSGVYLASLSSLAKNRRYTMGRNEAETFSCTLDLQALDKLAARIGEHPRNLLLPRQMNLRVKRAGEYLFGVQVDASPPDIASDGESIQVDASGYLNLLKDRTVTATFSQVEATSIATGIVSAVQAVSGGHMGITVSPTQYVTGVLRDRTYVREEAKDKLQRLTNLRDGRFDFRFSHDKVFRTYEALGAVRSDLRMVLGRNVSRAGFSQLLPRNRIIGLGSGFGTDQLVSVQDDAASEAGYYMREKVSLFNSVQTQSVLDQNVAAQLAYYRELRYIPVVTITGHELPPQFLSIGDRLFVDLTASRYTDNILGWHRLERMEVDLDDNDFESSIRLYFDNDFVDPETGENV